MRNILLMICLIAFINSRGQQIQTSDSLEIVSMIKDWDNSWNSKDHHLASKWYSDDARFTNAFGHKMTGRQEIEGLLKEVFSLPFVMSGKSETVEQFFQPLDENIVLVHTVVERTGQKMPDGSAIPSRRTSHLRVFEKNARGWQVKAHLISDARDRESNKH